MASNVQKTAIARTLNQFAQRKVRGTLAQLGQALPAQVVSRQGGIVTVKFPLTGVPYTLPNVTVPIVGAEYVRLPIQAGCPGMVMTADAYLGGVTGLGGGVANLTQRANLATLVWTPLGNKAWPAVEDDNALVLYGPNGVIIRDKDKKNILTINGSTVKLSMSGGTQFEIDGDVVLKGDLLIQGNIKSETGGTYAGALETSGAVIAGFGGADQVGLQTHTHTQSNDSHGDTEQPTAAPTAGT